MSKFLKFIVHFIVICTILCVVALAAPPFFGITTVIRDDSSQRSNLSLGSVTYAIPVKTEEASIGMPILVNDEKNVYRYNIASLDLSNQMGTVVDPRDVAGEPVYVAVKNYVPKIVITVPYLGYLLVATESIEGLIVLGLAVLFLIILYVIAELWKKDSADDYEEEYDESVRLKSNKELRREEKARDRRMKAEDKEFLREEKLRQKEERKNRKIIKTGGFVDEIYEDEMEREDAPVAPRRRNVQSATSEAHELLKKEIAAATADDSGEMPPVKRKASSGTRASRSGEAARANREPEEVQKMAIPLYTAAQLAEKAKQEGDAPDIIRDEITKVTLFDYSDIIGGDEEE